MIKTVQTISSILALENHAIGMAFARARSPFDPDAAIFLVSSENASRDLLGFLHDGNFPNLEKQRARNEPEANRSQLSKLP